MRRLWILGVALLVLAFGLVAAAGAVPPKCADDPTLPGCGSSDPDDQPLAGTECVVFGQQDNPFAVIGTESTDFSLELGYRQDACIDVSNVDPGQWTVNVDVTNGTLRELLVIPRDSVAPGDACAVARYRNTIPDQFTLPGAPGDYVNACGTDFAEMVGDTYYDTVEEGIASPLAFLVFQRGTKDLAFTLTVDYPNTPVS